MMREIPKQIFWWVLALAVALFLYGREQRHAGRDMEREQVLRSQIAITKAHADSVVVDFRHAVHRADSLARLVPVFTARRASAMVRTDSVVVRVDSIFTAFPDTLRPVIQSLLSTVKAERMASDSAIQSLELTVSALQRTIGLADSALVARDAMIRTQAAALVALERRANPPILLRVLSAGRWVLVGAVAALAWVAVP